MIFSKHYWNYRWLMIGKKAKWMTVRWENSSGFFSILLLSGIKSIYILFFFFFLLFSSSYSFSFIESSLHLSLSLYSVLNTPCRFFYFRKPFYIYPPQAASFFSCCIAYNHLPSFKLSLLRSFLPLVWLISSILPACLPSFYPASFIPSSTTLPSLTPFKCKLTLELHHGTK